jgi:serine/threonine protein kinase
MSPEDDLGDAPRVSALERKRLAARLKAQLFRKPAAPVQVGPHTVTRKLGQGGVGTVYATADPLIAVKIIERTTNAARKRLLREAQAMRTLQHPNIVRVFDAGETDDGMYLAMEFVPGGTLREWLEAPRTRAEILPVFERLAAALAAAHGLGIVHRDVKPDNVLMGADGQPKLADFGLARAAVGTEAELLTHLAEKLTRTGAAVGTIGYAAPEQLRATPVDHRADQFGLAATLFEALYGIVPFADGVALAVTRGCVEPPPPGTDVPEALHRVILRALCVDPADRFADVADFAAALRI